MIRPMETIEETAAGERCEPAACSTLRSPAATPRQATCAQVASAQSADPTSSPEHAAKAAGGVVGLRAVVVHEDGVVAAITEQRATELPDPRRRAYPTRRRRVELLESLQCPVLLLGQELGAPSRCHVRGAVLRLVLLPRVERSTVVTHASASFRALHRTVDEDVFAAGLLPSHDIRFTSGRLHLVQRPECAKIGRAS